MGRRKVYCEVEFFKQFLEVRPESISLTEENISNHKTWINFFEFILKSDILFDNSDEFKKNAIENELFKLLWKKSIDNPKRLEFINDQLPIFKDVDSKEDHQSLCSIFLTTVNTEQCNKVSQNFGINVINIESVFQFHHLFNTFIETIEYGNKSHKNWNFLKKRTHPCNSLCLADNYIFNSSENIDKNLIPLFDILLPETLEVPFHISIFTIRTHRTQNIQHDFNTIKSELEEKIKGIRANLDVKLGIFESTKQDYHDRAIITNNMLIESGSGFDIFRTNDTPNDTVSRHRTKITCFYHHFPTYIKTTRNGQEINIYDYLLAKMASKYFQQKMKHFATGRWKEFENRLLEVNT